jgi:hypothetical protein
MWDKEQPFLPFADLFLLPSGLRPSAAPPKFGETHDPA